MDKKRAHYKEEDYMDYSFINFIKVIEVIAFVTGIVIAGLFSVRITVACIKVIFTKGFPSKLVDYLNKLFERIGNLLLHKLHKVSETRIQSGCYHDQNLKCNFETSPVIKAAEITIRTLKIRKAQELEGLSPCYCNSTMFGFAEKIKYDMCVECSYRHSCDCRIDTPPDESVQI